jgi:hypothetical protein
MSVPILERRRNRRVTASQHPGRIGLGAPIEVLDLSFAGALVESEQWLAPDRQYPLRLEPGIQLAGLVTRCAVHRIETTASGRRPVYRAAVLFAPPSDDVRCQLLILLRSLAQLEPTVPLPLELAVAV